MAPVSGHVFRVEGARGPVWRREVPAAGRAPGPADDRARRGRSAAARRRATSRSAPPRRGCATSSRRRAPGRCPGWSAPASTFADACDEYLRYVEVDRDRKPSTLHGLPLDRSGRTCCRPSARCGSRTSPPSAIEAWKATLTVSNRTKAKILTILNGVLEARAPRAQAPATTRWPTSRSRASATIDGDRGLLARGGLGARPRRRVRAGRRDLPHRGVHRPAPRRARRAALARRRLRALSGSRRAAPTPAGA